MNKKILLSLSIIGIASAILIGGTVAYFSDSKVSADNTFTAGTILLDTDTEGPVFTIEGKPCQEFQEIVTLVNVGMNNGIADLHFKNVVDDGGLTVGPECEAEGGEWINEECIGNTPIDDISTKLNINIGYDVDGSGEIEEDEYLIWDDANQNGVIDPGELYFGDNPNADNSVATLAQLESVDFDLALLPAEEERKLELSMHLQWDADNEYQGDYSTFDIEFTLHQIPTCVLNEDLDYLDIGDEASEVGHLTYFSDDWSFIGDPDHNGGGYLKLGGYGGYDGGEANFRGLIGPDTGCGDEHWHATFIMDAGSGIATKLALRHLDGSQNDSFDVFIVQGGQDYVVGHYEWDGNTAEEWKTTEFVLPTSANRTGEIEFKLVSTDPVIPWCDSGWGQVMFNWAGLTGCK